MLTHKQERILLCTLSTVFGIVVGIPVLLTVAITSWMIYNMVLVAIC
jgi:hypothetical protein